MIEPLVERLAEEKGVGQNGRGVAFAKIEISGMGNTLAGQYGIRATPTFLFFLDGEKVCCSYPCGDDLVHNGLSQISEMKGANAPELRSQVDLLLFQAYPRWYML
jgi:hypothetical protein